MEFNTDSKNKKIVLILGHTFGSPNLLDLWGLNLTLQKISGNVWACQFIKLRHKFVALLVLKSCKIIQPHKNLFDHPKTRNIFFSKKSNRIFSHFYENYGGTFPNNLGNFGAKFFSHFFQIHVTLSDRQSDC